MITAGERGQGVLAPSGEPRRWRAPLWARWESVLVLLLVAICAANAAVTARSDDFSANR